MWNLARLQDRCRARIRRWRVPVEELIPVGPVEKTPGRHKRRHAEVACDRVSLVAIQPTGPRLRVAHSFDFHITEPSSSTAYWSDGLDRGGLDVPVGGRSGRNSTNHDRRGHRRGRSRGSS